MSIIRAGYAWHLAAGVNFPAFSSRAIDQRHRAHPTSNESFKASNHSLSSICFSRHRHWRVALTPSQMKKRSSRKKKNNQSNFLVYNFEIQLFSPSLLARLWKPLANTRFSFLPENQHGRRSVRVRWKGHHFLLFPYIFLWYSPRTLNLLCLEDHKITR